MKRTTGPTAEPPHASHPTPTAAASRGALQNKHGWLFEDENYAGFVNWMKSVLEYEHFHQMMVTAAKKQDNLSCEHK